MKRKLSIILTVVLVFTMLSGCGIIARSQRAEAEKKAEAERIAEKKTEQVTPTMVNYTPNSVTSPNNSSTESDSSIDSISESTDTVSESIEEYEIKPYEVQKYPATQEIIDADFRDFKFQIDDLVFVQNDSMTVSEFLSQFSDKYTYMIYGENPYNASRIMRPSEEMSIEIYNNENNTKCLSFKAYNIETEPIDLSNCLARDLYFSKSYEGSIYAAKGIPLNESIEENASYNYTNIADTFKSYDEVTEIEPYSDVELPVNGFNVANFGFDSSVIKFKLAVIGDITFSATEGGRTENYYPYYLIIFKIDQDTGCCNELEFEFGSRVEYFGMGFRN